MHAIDQHGLLIAIAVLALGLGCNKETGNSKNPAPTNQTSQNEKETDNTKHPAPTDQTKENEKKKTAVESNQTQSLGNFVFDWWYLKGDEA
jgi:hypothetical protein